MPLSTPLLRRGGIEGADVVGQRGSLASRDSFALPKFRATWDLGPKRVRSAGKGTVQSPNSARGGRSMASSPNPHHSPLLPVLSTPRLPSSPRPPNPVLSLVLQHIPPVPSPAPEAPAPRAAPGQPAANKRLMSWAELHRRARRELRRPLGSVVPQAAGQGLCGEGRPSAGVWESPWGSHLAGRWRRRDLGSGPRSRVSAVSAAGEANKVATGSARPPRNSSCVLTRRRLQTDAGTAQVRDKCRPWGPGDGPKHPRSQS